MQLPGRSPANTAMTAMTLNLMSKGRFTLGLGASGPQVVEGWHGVRFAHTLPRIRDAVNIVRMASRGERVAYKGDYYELPLPGGEGKALRTSAPPQEFPIYLATLSPNSLELTGEIADGWVGTSFMPEHADVFFDHIRKGAERAGRTLADVDLQAAAGAVAFGDDLEKLIAPRRPGLAFTLGAMGSRQHNFYNAAYRRAGYADEAIAVQKLYLEGKRDEAAALVPDEMVLQTNLIGTELAERARDVSLRIYQEGADWAAERGILLADTKFELGLIDGELILCDEVLTPDSSRFWPADAWVPGSTPPSFDKQPVRDYLNGLDWDKTPPPPPLGVDIVAATRSRYVEAYERITGRSFADWPG
jgi:F420-dependent oxidoreductase-like protein